MEWGANFPMNASPRGAGGEGRFFWGGALGLCRTELGVSILYNRPTTIPSSPPAFSPAALENWGAPGRSPRNVEQVRETPQHPGMGRGKLRMHRGGGKLGVQERTSIQALGKPGAYTSPSPQPAAPRDPLAPCAPPVRPVRPEPLTARATPRTSPARRAASRPWLDRVRGLGGILGGW